jgi:hypothetical protein
MPYKDNNKKILYQRNYMRLKRLKLKQSYLKQGLLDPIVRPKLDADGNIIYDN